MRLFVSKILILVILTCQGLVSGHAHSRITSGHSASHSGQPHFHVHGSHFHKSHHRSGHHHDDAPGMPAVTSVPFPLHDCHAFYCADSVVSLTQCSSFSETSCFVLQELATDAVRFVPLEAFPALEDWADLPRHWNTTRTALYLRDLSIRC